ncbi:MAG: DUF3352 domain-containing protein [Candidatus Dormibacteria bacterium]
MSEYEMPSSGGFEAPVEAPQPPRRGIGGRLALIIAVLVVLVAVPAAAFVLTRAVKGAGESHDTMVPSDANVYMAAFLDPSLGQKKNLLDVLHRFPKLKTDTDLENRLNTALNDAFKDSQLSYTGDIKPWLGAQVTSAGQVIDEKTVHFAILVASRNDDLAQKSLDKLRASDKKVTWTSSKHDGVTTWVNSETAPNQGMSYALFEHTAVFSNSVDFLDEVIDTAHHKHATLKSTTDYTRAMSHLPADKLGVVYVNAQDLVNRFSSQLTKLAPGTTADEAIKALHALRSVGMAAVAESNGIGIRSEIDIDAASLTAQQKESLKGVGRLPASLSWTPPDAFAAFAVVTPSGPFQQSLEDQAAKAPDTVKPFLDQLGITSSSGIVSHLTGDFGVEVMPGKSQYPTGALMVGTSDEAGMRTFLKGIVQAGLGFAAAAEQKQFTTLSGSLSSNSSTNPNSTYPGSSVLPRPAPRPDLSKLTRTDSYKGVQIVSLAFPGLPGGFAPAYSVTGGMALVGASPDAIRALIDAHSGTSILSSDTYKAATQSDGLPEGVFFVDVEAAAKAYRAAVPVGGTSGFDTAYADLAPVRAFGITTVSHDDRSSSRFFAVIR